MIPTFEVDLVQVFLLLVACVAWLAERRRHRRARRNLRSFRMPIRVRNKK
jgi:hypothetical protein